MLKKRESIDRLRVATPCPMNWEEMRGDDRTRFCEHCNLHVYNISELTAREVSSLISKTEGGICGRLYRRADGTVLTKDCPVGLRAIRRRASRMAGATITAVLSFCFGVLGQSRAQEDKVFEDGTRVKISRENKSYGQENLPPLTGVVTDVHGAVIAGMSVDIINARTKQRFRAFTDEEGRFNFPAVEAGTYQVEAMATGFQPFILDELNIYTGEMINLDITLQVISGDTIIVGFLIGDSDEVINPDTSASGLKTTFSPNKITKLPF